MTKSKVKYYDYIESEWEKRITEDKENQKRFAESLVAQCEPKRKNLQIPGAKDDSEKLRTNLVYEHFIHALQEVWKDGTFGANKYSPYGWKSVPDARNRYLDAFMRHYDKYLMGEKIDQESNVHHLGACVWNLLAVLELELTNG